MFYNASFYNASLYVISCNKRYYKLVKNSSSTYTALCYCDRVKTQ